MMYGPPKIMVSMGPASHPRLRATANGDMRERIHELLGHPGRLGRVDLIPDALAGWVDGLADDKPWLPLNRQAMDLLALLRGPGRMAEEDATVRGTMVVTGLLGVDPTGLLEEQITLLEHATGEPLRSGSAAPPR